MFMAYSEVPPTAFNKMTGTNCNVRKNSEGSKNGTPCHHYAITVMSFFLPNHASKDVPPRSSPVPTNRPRTNDPPPSPVRCQALKLADAEQVTQLERLSRALAELTEMKKGAERSAAALGAARGRVECGACVRVVGAAG